MIGRLFALLLVLLVAFVAYMYHIPSQWVGQGGASLLGEAWIDETTAGRFADFMLEEACDIWSQSDHEWFTYTNTSGLVVQSRRIDKGPFNASGILLTRGAAIVTGSSAESLYQLLISPKGFALIDPASDPKEFSKHAERFEDTPSRRLEVAHAFALSSHFCVLNAFVHDHSTFISKSIQHRSCQGTSVYGEAPTKGRALNTFAIRTTNVADQDAVLLEMINYVDIAMPIPMNYINVAIFLQGLVDRVRQEVKKVNLASSSKGERKRDAFANEL